MQQHDTPGQWHAFLQLLERGRKIRTETGISPMVSRWDIVPIPEDKRAHLPSGSIMEFPCETAQSMFDFAPNSVIGNIAPRPLLLLHSARDDVTPVEQSIDMFRHAGPSAELMLIANVDHFPYSAKSDRLRSLVGGWLAENFPPKSQVV
jgi:uncharacterized protein